MHLPTTSLALQVLAKEPATLEKAFQTATKLQSNNQIRYNSDKHKSNQHETHVNVIRNPEACRHEDDLSSNTPLKEMAEAIQQLSKQIGELSQSKLREQAMPGQRLEPF